MSPSQSRVLMGNACEERAGLTRRGKSMWAIESQKKGEALTIFLLGRDSGLHRDPCRGPCWPRVPALSFSL